MNNKAVHVMMPQELYDKVKKEASDKNISLASMVRLIFSEYFMRQTK